MKYFRKKKSVKLDNELNIAQPWLSKHKKSADNHVLEFM